MMNNKLPKFLSVVVLSLLAGCANLEAIHYTRNLEERTLVTDASQRAIVNFSADKAAKDGEKLSRKHFLCAEPSPDVAFALSSAIRLSLGYQTAGSESPGTSGPLAGPSKNVGINFDKSSVAQIAQLGERLAVIQLLRDKMYRACEAYANGAISKVSYTLMLARLDKTMMSLLSSELAAGAFGRSLAVLGSGTAESGGLDKIALQEQEKEITKLVNEIKGLKFEVNSTATEKSPDYEKLTGLLKKLDQELFRLYGMESATARTSARGSTTSTNIGTITGDHNGSTEAVVAIQRAFIDDDGTEALSDACIQALADIQIEMDEKEQITLSNRLVPYRSCVIEKQTAVNDIDDDLSRLERERERELRPLQNQKDNKQRATIVARYQGDLNKKLAAREALQSEQEKCDSKALTLVSTTLLSQKGGVFASMCYERILGGSSFYLNKRMKQKRDLRELEDDRLLKSLPTNVQALDFCRAALSDRSFSAAEKAQLAKSCASVVSAIGKEGANQQPGSPPSGGKAGTAAPKPAPDVAAPDKN